MRSIFREINIENVILKEKVQMVLGSWRENVVKCKDKFMREITCLTQNHFCNGRF